MCINCNKACAELCSMVQHQKQHSLHLWVINTLCRNFDFDIMCESWTNACVCSCVQTLYVSSVGSRDQTNTCHITSGSSHAHITASHRHTVLHAPTPAWIHANMDTHTMKHVEHTARWPGTDMRMRDQGVPHLGALTHTDSVRPRQRLRNSSRGREHPLNGCTLDTATYKYTWMITCVCAHSHTCGVHIFSHALQKTHSLLHGIVICAWAVVLHSQQNTAAMLCKWI